MSTLLEQASLVMIPSGYKEDIVYSQIPTNGNGDLSFTRASNGTRINSQGLVEVCPWNLATDSENFSAVYSGINASISNNTTSAPNATTTADSLLETTATDIHAIFTDYTQQSGVQYTYSVYVKSISGRNVRVSGSSGFTGPIALVDLSNGSLLSGSTGASVESVGNGWYRISLTATTTTTTVRVIIYSMNGTDTTFAGSTSNGLYLWGAQLNIGSTAKPYFPTTDRLNVPRLTYQNGGGGCPSLLLEPQRTNLVLYSEQFDNAYWLKANVTITANQETSPDGTQNADLLSATNGVTSFLYKSFTLTTGTPYTLSIYVKKKTVTISSNRFRINFVNNLFVDFSGSVPVITGGSGSIQNAANGFYRIITTVTPSVASNVLYIYPDGNNNYADEYYIYGAQLEAGAYPTTYIPTTSATATRVVDFFSRNNIYTNGLISASGGTWFVELRGNVAYIGDAGGDGLYLWTIGNVDNFRFFSPNSSSRIQIWKRVSNVNTPLYTTTTDTVKVAIKWNGSTADVFVNGTKVVSATSFAITQLQEFATSINGAPKFIQQMALFPTPLSDTDCATLTT